MRECEIDLVAELGEATLVGFSSGRHISLSSVRDCLLWTALTGKALLIHFSSLLIRVNTDFDDDGVCRMQFLM